MAPTYLEEKKEEEEFEPTNSKPSPYSINQPSLQRSEANERRPARQAQASRSTPTPTPTAFDHRRTASNGGNGAFNDSVYSNQWFNNRTHNGLPSNANPTRANTPAPTAATAATQFQTPAPPPPAPAPAPAPAKYTSGVTRFVNGAYVSNIGLGAQDQSHAMDFTLIACPNCVEVFFTTQTFIWHVPNCQGNRYIRHAPLFGLGPRPQA